jgi:uncharacterized protein (TIGR02246 family)
MNDEHAIQQVITAYSVATSRGDDPAMLDLYVENGVWSVPGIGLHLEGRKAIAGGMAAIRGQFDYVVQVNSPATITVTGDTASAASVIRESGKYAGRDAAAEILGVYADDLVRTADGWKFARRLFELHGKHDFPLLSSES